MGKSVACKKTCSLFELATIIAGNISLFRPLSTMGKTAKASFVKNFVQIFPESKIIFSSKNAYGYNEALFLLSSYFAVDCELE